ncbi:MAG: thioredoxin domain-containing protein [Parcubacteria group bacterium]|nr:thioredoxin domain-containing protein [Parcubacteria group bacterium]
MKPETQEINKLFIPLAIIIAGIIIAGAVIFASRKSDDQIAPSPNTNTETLKKIRPVSSNDHILGNIKTAEVFLVEFSDLECPFCKDFHETLKQIITEYGPNGKVAWVYRHFPLESIHPKAAKEAEATECASELGGTIKFWEYADRIFQITPSNNGLDLSLLPLIAKDVGLDTDAFGTCLEDGRYAQKVKSDLEDAINSGGRGTPHTIVITKDGSRALPISGAQSVDVVRSTIEQLLKKP